MEVLLKTRTNIEDIKIDYIELVNKQGTVINLDFDESSEEYDKKNLIKYFIFNGINCYANNDFDNKVKFDFFRNWKINNIGIYSDNANDRNHYEKDSILIIDSLEIVLGPLHYQVIDKDIAIFTPHNNVYDFANVNKSILDNYGKLLYKILDKEICSSHS